MRFRVGAAAALLLALAGCVKQKPRPAQAGAEVTFFDVGQGDAALIRTPEGRSVLIDAGHNAAAARRLKDLGISKLDLLILTHPHDDHIGGVPAVAKVARIGEIWYSGIDYKPRMLARLRAAGTLRTVVAGERTQLGGITLTVLHPDARPARARAAKGNPNNDSVVIKAAYGSSGYLFPGDCELECWDELFRGHRAELRAAVLKAAHHGSSNGTNSGVLVNVRPQVFVISAGRDNEYHHPHAIVLRLIGKLGAQLFRTDEQGEIRCRGVECAPAPH